MLELRETERKRLNRMNNANRALVSSDPTRNCTPAQARLWLGFGARPSAGVVPSQLRTLIAKVNDGLDKLNGAQIGEFVVAQADLYDATGTPTNVVPLQDVLNEGVFAAPGADPPTQKDAMNVYFYFRPFASGRDQEYLDGGEVMNNYKLGDPVLVNVARFWRELCADVENAATWDATILQAFNVPSLAGYAAKHLSRDMAGILTPPDPLPPGAVQPTSPRYIERSTVSPAVLQK